jgi:UDP-glucuronate 4-epimerase
MSVAKYLVTGPTGQVGLPVAKALAADNEVWAIARFNDRAAREQLEGAGVRCEVVDLVNGDFSSLPDDFTYVLNFGVSKAGTWDGDLDGNAASLGFLMEHCRHATAFLHCSSTAVYQPNGHHAFREDDPLGDNHRVYETFIPFMQTYSITKIAAEGMARYGARRWNLPTTIARLCVPYGDNGGWPAIHLDMKLGGMPVPVHTDAPSRYNPIHEDDIIAMIPGMLSIASVPPTVVNWGGEPATIEEWCALLGDITGLELETVATDQTLESVTVDTSRLQNLVGSTKVDLRDGLQRMVSARHPELLR